MPSLHNLLSFLRFRGYHIVFWTFLFLLLIFTSDSPLFNYLGYDYSLLWSVAFFFLIPFYAGFLFRSYPFSKTVLILGIYSLIPLITGVFINSSFPRSITILPGLWFYLLMVLPAIIMFTVWGYTLRNSKFYITGIILTVLLLIMLLQIGFEFYLFPKVYFYNPVATFISGVIYDDVLLISGDMVKYRIVSFIVMTALPLTLTHFVNKGKFRSNKAVLVLIILVVFDFPIRIATGFVDSSQSINANLSEVINTEKVIFHFAKNIDKDEQNYIVMLHNYYLSKLDTFFRFTPKHKLNSYIFENAYEKKILYGTANADMARIWDNSVFVDRKTVYKNIKHELAHLYTSKFGSSPFKVSYNTSLLEGIASAAAGTEGKYDIDYLAYQIISAKPNLDIGLLVDKSNFFSHSANISYNISGAFCRWLIHKYGIDKFILYYTTLDYRQSFDADIVNDSKLFRKYLSDFEFGEDTMLTTFYRGSKATLSNDYYKFIGTEIHNIELALQNDRGEWSELLKRVDNLILLNANPELRVLRYNILLKMKNYIESEKELLYLETVYRYSKFAQSNLFQVYALEGKTDKIKEFFSDAKKGNGRSSNEQLSLFSLLFERELLLNYLNAPVKSKKETLFKVLERENVNFVFPEIINISEKSDLRFLESETFTNLIPFMDISVLSGYIDFLMKNGSKSNLIITQSISRMERILTSSVKYKSYYSEKINFYKFYIDNRK